MLVDTPVDAACVAAVDRAADAARRAGPRRCGEVPAPLDAGRVAAVRDRVGVLALAPVPPDREELLLPITRYLRARGAQVGAGALMAALSELQTQVRRGVAMTGGYDLLLCPTLAVPQAQVGWFTVDRRPGGRLRPAAPLLARTARSST